VERLEEQQHGEKCDKLWIEIIPEDGEGKTSLGESIPESLHQVLKLRRSKSSEENLKRKFVKEIVNLKTTETSS
jgi:hypothetical protein